MSTELDLPDLSGAIREELLLVRDLAWAITEKLHRVKNGCQRALINQLSENLGGAFSEEVRSAFAGALLCGGRVGFECVVSQPGERIDRTQV